MQTFTGVCILFLYAYFFPLTVPADLTVISLQMTSCPMSSFLRIHSPLEGLVETELQIFAKSPFFHLPEISFFLLTWLFMLRTLTLSQSLRLRILAFVINHLALVTWPPHSFSNMSSILPLQGLCICVLFSWKVLSLRDLQSLLFSFLLVSSNVTVKCCLYSPS